MSAGCKKCESVCSYLLPGLDEDTGESAEQDLVLGNLEAIGVRRFSEGTLLFEVGTNFVKLSGDLGIVGGGSNKSGQGGGSVSIASTLDQPARRLKRD